MRIDGYSSLTGPTPSSARNLAVGSGNQALDTAHSANSAADTVEISEQASQLMAAQQHAQPVDAATVAHVQQFMQNKLYDDPSLLAETAKKLAPMLLTDA